MTVRDFLLRAFDVVNVLTARMGTVNAIIFLAPISGFDQVLSEDKTVNRLVRLFAFRFVPFHLLLTHYASLFFYSSPSLAILSAMHLFTHTANA
jgi:hypothetical protein